MEDIRPYRNDDEDRRSRKFNEDDRRIEWLEKPADDEVPFHIPRD
ncbi:MAG TPA: hypothetical protein VGF69_25985 [Thermoanaerobaculia bacterium]|jgi:hypothetical protein